MVAGDGTFWSCTSATRGIFSQSLSQSGTSSSVLAVLVRDSCRDSQGFHFFWQGLFAPQFLVEANNAARGRTHEVMSYSRMLNPQTPLRHRVHPSLVENTSVKLVPLGHILTPPTGLIFVESYKSSRSKSLDTTRTRTRGIPSGFLIAFRADSSSPKIGSPSRGWLPAGCHPFAHKVTT